MRLFFVHRLTSHPLPPFLLLLLFSNINDNSSAVRKSSLVIFGNLYKGMCVNVISYQKCLIVHDNF